MSTLLWRSAQTVGLGLTAVLLVGLVLRPETTLDLLWNVVIPALPLVFLVNPALWRNACPLATVNMLANRPDAARQKSQRFATAAAPIGLVLLGLLVPARHFLFNHHGPALAATIVVVALAALALGMLFDAKAGFCNAMCPVLPVERLYGQAPLLTVSNPRCPSCTWCTRGCLDIAPQKAVPASLGRARRSHRWLITPFGAFAAMFPGFVLGYFLASDGPIGTAGAVYLLMAALSACSWALVAVLVIALKADSRRVLPVLAASAIGVYYWFASGPLSASLSIPDAAGGLRAGFLGFVALWLFRAQWAVSRSRAVATPGHQVKRAGTPILR